MTVILTLIDGLRPDAIRRDICPNLSRLIDESAYSLAAMSVMPSITLPCHMSIFHSVPPARHGVTTNDWSPLARPVPGLVDVASASGLRCAFFYNWEQLRNLSRPGNLHFSYCRNTSDTDPGSDGEIVEIAARFIRTERPDFAFVYLGTVDAAGHAFGWMTDGYFAQINRVDGMLGMLVDARNSHDVVLVQSDHGGHERNHGLDIPEDMTIPWLVSGAGIRAGYRIETSVSLLDSAPTLARLLDLAPPPQWEGRCVEEIFH